MDNSNECERCQCLELIESERRGESRNWPGPVRCWEHSYADRPNRQEGKDG